MDDVLREGHIRLSGLQLRAHAMFSTEGLPLGTDSLEYAWLIDVQAGNLTAKVTAPQVSRLASDRSVCLVLCSIDYGFYRSIKNWKKWNY